MIKQNRYIELTPVSPKPLEHIIKFKVQTSKFNVTKKNVSALSKNDGLIRCANYNMARNPCQHPGNRKRKSPESQNTARSEIRGKSTAKNNTSQTNNPAVISRVIKL